MLSLWPTTDFLYLFIHILLLEIYSIMRYSNWRQCLRFVCQLLEAIRTINHLIRVHEKFTSKINFSITINKQRTRRLLLASVVFVFAETNPKLILYRIKVNTNRSIVRVKIQLRIHWIESCIRMQWISSEWKILLIQSQIWTSYWHEHLLRSPTSTPPPPPWMHEIASASGFWCCLLSRILTKF